MSKEINKELEQLVFVKIDVPEKFIGYWCITENFGTHCSYDIISHSADGMVFKTKQQADAYKRAFIPEESRNWYCSMQVTKDYPVWQTKMYLCGLSEQDLLAMPNKLSTPYLNKLKEAEKVLQELMSEYEKLSKDFVRAYNLEWNDKYQQLLDKSLSKAKQLLTKQ